MTRTPLLLNALRSPLHTALGDLHISSTFRSAPDSLAFEWSCIWFVGCAGRCSERAHSVVMRQSVVTWLANPLRIFAKSRQRSTVLAAFVTENTSAHPEGPVQSEWSQSAVGAEVDGVTGSGAFGMSA